MIRNAWRIPGGVGAAANTANRRVLVTNKDGSQQVVTVNNELGMRAGDKGDIRSRLAKQGVDTENIDLYGGMDTRDKKTNSVPPARFASQPTREAWGVGGASSRGVAAGSTVVGPTGARGIVGGFDPAESLRRALYDPPVGLEALANKLQLSAAAGNPRFSTLIQHAH